MGKKGSHPPGGNNLYEEIEITNRLATIKSWRRNGLSKSAVAEKLDISESTLYKWINEKPDFAEAVRLGGEESDALVEDSLFKMAMGFVAETSEGEKYIAPNFNAVSFYLTNRAAQRWKRNPEASDEFKALTTLLTASLGLTPEQIQAVIDEQKKVSHGSSPAS